MRSMNSLRSLSAALVVSALALTGCEPGPKDVVQNGFRGTAMESVYNPFELAEDVSKSVPPEPLPQVPATGPKAKDVYQNVQVLGDLSIGEFTRLMAAMTEWVAPEEGCTYCHAGNNFAEDNVYTKKVARVMLAMTQRANESYDAHMAPTGVTCYTCHRGKAVPEYVWTEDPGHQRMPGIDNPEQNIASPTAAYASLPYDPLTPFLQEDNPIRVISDSALPQGSRKSIKQTEWTYSLMMHFSDSLGVNCTYCHNSRAFSVWEQSPPQRMNAWHAIRQVREMNNVYIQATAEWLPENRKGPLGDPLKIGCNTCHQGAYKPMYGARMLPDYPNLATMTGMAKEMANADAEQGTVTASKD